MNVDKFRSILEERTSYNSETGCWEYLGVRPDGYGKVMIDRQTYLVHVLSAMIFFGYRPTRGLMICHRTICRSKSCWNPEHLYIGDAKENAEDMIEVGNARGRYTGATHCVNGHEFTSVNTRWARNTNGQMRRQCRLCCSRRSYEHNKRRTEMKLLKKAVS